MGILNDEEKLKSVMKSELRSVRNEYATPRKTQVKDEITEIKIDELSMIPKEDCIVVVTKDGYVKRVSKRSYSQSDEETGLKELDYIIGIYELNTMDTVLIFTDIGNYLYVPVYEIPDMKWKDLGKHISNIIKINPDENIINCIAIRDFNENKYITIFTKFGMVKRTSISELKVTRYTKPMTYIKLKDGDKVSNVCFKEGTDVFITTHNGFGLRYDINEIPIIGPKGSGVKAISLKNDEVVSGNIISDYDEYISIITKKNTGKRVKISEFERISRARKGIQIIRDVKTNPYYILNSYIINSKDNIGLKLSNDIVYFKNTDLPILDRYSTGTSLSKQTIFESFIEKNIVNIDDKNSESQFSNDKQVTKVELNQIDKKILTIDDFLDKIEM